MPKLVLLKPLLTEKSMRLARAGQFSFLVTETAGKGAVKAAAESQFKVKVLKVTLGRTGAKTKKTGKKRLTVTVSGQKKAVLSLEKGQSLEFFKLPEKKK